MFQISETPRHYADCCLSLSTPLFQTVQRYAQRVRHDADVETLLLSIGAGTGLFEYYLTCYLREHDLNNIRVEAVEVQSAVMKYLSTDAVHRVQGTWDISDQAQNAHVLLFVYPREPQLVKKYLERFQNNVQLVLWFGPMADWAEHNAVLHDVATFSNPTVLEDMGLATYELAVILENKVYTPDENAIDPTRHERSMFLDINMI